jgi:hypothetical protein
MKALSRGLLKSALYTSPKNTPNGPDIQQKSRKILIAILAVSLSF